MVCVDYRATCLSIGTALLDLRSAEVHHNVSVYKYAQVPSIQHVLLTILREKSLRADLWSPCSHHRATCMSNNSLSD